MPEIAHPGVVLCAKNIVLNQNTGVPVKGYAQGASPSTGTRGFLTGTALPEIEPVEVHHFGPCGNEIVHKPVL